MFFINPNTLYSRTELATKLEPLGVDVDTFIGRLKPEKKFKMLYRGSDILKAWDAAPTLAEREEKPEPPKPANRGNRRGRKAKKQEGGGRLIAGMFTADELGL